MTLKPTTTTQEPWVQLPVPSTQREKKYLIKKFDLDISGMAEKPHWLSLWPYRGVTTKCGNCEIQFQLGVDQRMKIRKNETEGVLFCKMKCQNIWNRATFNPIISRKHAKKIGVTKRARAEELGRTNGYQKVDNRHYHRTVAEEKIGRSLVKGEIVHHIDNDKRNNHPDNLEVMTQAQHAKIHKTEYWASKQR